MHRTQANDMAAPMMLLSLTSQTGLSVPAHAPATTHLCDPAPLGPTTVRQWEKLRERLGHSKVTTAAHQLGAAFFSAVSLVQIWTTRRGEMCRCEQPRTDVRGARPEASRRTKQVRAAARARPRNRVSPRRRSRPPGRASNDRAWPSRWCGAGPRRAEPPGAAQC